MIYHVIQIWMLTKNVMFLCENTVVMDIDMWICIGYFFQFDKELNGSLASSYVEYQSSLVDECLHGPWHGCNRSIGLWFKIEHNVSSPSVSVLLTTIERDGDDRGFRLYVLYWYRLFFCYYTNSPFTADSDESIDRHQCCQVNLVQTIGYQHVMIVYNGKSDLKMYLNFTEVNLDCGHSIQTFQRHGVVTRYMASGRNPTSIYNITGFGYIDELIVFPYALTVSQIGELQHVYRNKQQSES